MTPEQSQPQDLPPQEGPPPTINDPNSQKNEILARIQMLEQFGSLALANDIRKQYKHILNPDVPHSTTVILQHFITQDEKMLEAKKEIGLLAEHSDTVLISGPTGTGKELLARALHGDRDGNKFFALNCAAISPHLVESILFGHVKGSFTGADRTVEGIFRQANEGTLLLDEVGELPPDVQSKLLRVIQERVVMRVGGDKYEPVTCRLVCATLKNLEEMVDENRFREDLFWRINTFHIKLSPLMSRIDDIPLIVDYVATKYENELKVKANKVFPRKTHLDPMNLKGNVRSIQQIVRRYHVFGEVRQ